MKLSDKDLDRMTPRPLNSLISRYMNFIRKHGATHKPTDGTYVEHHHIVFKELNMDGKVYLSHRAHVIAHWMLWRIFQTPTAALGFRLVVNQNLGHQGKRKQSAPLILRAVGRASKKGTSGKNNTFYGRTHSATTRDKISKAKLGRKTGPASEARKQAISKALTGRKRTQEQCENIARGRVKQAYVFIDPDGNRHSVPFNLAAFCREHNLHHGHMTSLGRGKLKTHKGWTVEETVSPFIG